MLLHELVIIFMVSDDNMVCSILMHPLSNTKIAVIAQQI